MIISPRPDDGFVNPEPDVEGHMVELPVTGVTEDEPEDDVEGHMAPTDKRIDR
jgi:hypothetical protein